MNLALRTIAIVSVISAFIGVLFTYRSLYVILGFFATRKFPAAKKLHKYAILVAARNEEMVIGNLIESIRSQDYPSELVDIFVVADNCTDNTASIARSYGAICYERNDTTKRTKGYALQYLVECIRKDYGIDSYEGYFIFDADNLLKKDFISRMNDSFDAGEKIVTSYRNTKNFDDNWISASYGVHWLRTVRGEHRARSLFRLATRIQGTGFLFSWEIIKDGWNYTSLTEDRAFCADAVANGYKISYNNDAEFYDEQPVDMKIAWRQRIRWAKGHLQAFIETGWKLFSHIFVTGGAANNAVVNNVEELTTFQKFINNIRLRFSSFDMLTVVYPRSVFKGFATLLVWALKVYLIIITGAWVANGSTNYIIDLFNWSPENTGIAEKIIWLTIFTLSWQITGYIGNIATAVYVYIIEAKRIKKIKWYKKAWFCLTFPLFDIIGKISMYIALFSHVEWKPIPHTSSVKISDIENQK